MSHFVFCFFAAVSAVTIWHAICKMWLLFNTLLLFHCQVYMWKQYNAAFQIDEMKQLCGRVGLKPKPFCSLSFGFVPGRCRMPSGWVDRTAHKSTFNLSKNHISFFLSERTNDRQYHFSLLKKKMNFYFWTLWPYAQTDRVISFSHSSWMREQKRWSKVEEIKKIIRSQKRWENFAGAVHKLRFEH